jgi:hypothetical protein
MDQLTHSLNEALRWATDHWQWALPTLLVLLSLPRVRKERTFKSLLLAFAQLAVGIVLPLFWFCITFMMLPEWKGGHYLPVTACFAYGKVWLLPLVLWTATAFYVRVVIRSTAQSALWVMLGYLTGAIISDVCLVWALLCATPMLLYVWPFVVPVGVAIYYTTVSLRMLRERPLSFQTKWLTFCINAPFWVASIWQSFRTYDQLPDEPPSCFVVTAASRGHPSLVGPFTQITRRGQLRMVNDQLLTFWELEKTWSQRSPRSHRLFRCLYNRLGPRLASCLKNPWLADLAYLCLKPLEWLARRALR